MGCKRDETRGTALAVSGLGGGGGEGQRAREQGGNFSKSTAPSPAYSGDPNQSVKSLLTCAATRGTLGRHWLGAQAKPSCGKDHPRTPRFASVAGPS